MPWPPIKLGVGQFCRATTNHVEHVVGALFSAEVGLHCSYICTEDSKTMLSLYTASTSTCVVQTFLAAGVLARYRWERLLSIRLLGLLCRNAEKSMGSAVFRVESGKEIVSEGGTMKFDHVKRYNVQRRPLEQCIILSILYT